jgi:hypothetical protein
LLCRKVIQLVGRGVEKINDSFNILIQGHLEELCGTSLRLANRQLRDHWNYWRKRLGDERSRLKNCSTTVYFIRPKQRQKLVPLDSEGETPVYSSTVSVVKETP